MSIGGSAFNRGVHFVSDDYIAKFVMGAGGDFTVTTEKRLKITGVRKRVRRIPIIKGLFSMFQGNRWMFVIVISCVLSDILAYKESINGSVTSLPVMIVAAAITLVMVIFLVYMIKTMFYRIGDTWRYHGAEHKTIYAYENGLDLTLENVRGCPRVAKRCGTNLVVFMIFIYVLLSFFLEYQSIKLIVAYVIAYELFDLKKGDETPVIKYFFKLGYWCQKHVFTLEPTDNQIMASIAAIQKLLEMQGCETLKAK